MSIKKDKKKVLKVLDLDGEFHFLNLEKEDFLSFSMSNDMDCESFNSNGDSLLKGVHWYVYHIYRTACDCDKRKKFCSDTFVTGKKKSSMMRNLTNLESLTKREDRRNG